MNKRPDASKFGGLVTLGAYTRLGLIQDIFLVRSISRPPTPALIQNTALKRADDTVVGNRTIVGEITSLYTQRHRFHLLDSYCLILHLIKINYTRHLLLPVHDLVQDDIFDSF